MQAIARDIAKPRANVGDPQHILERSTGLIGRCPVLTLRCRIRFIGRRIAVLFLIRLESSLSHKRGS